MNLDDLRGKYNTDKFSHGHWYTRYYSEMFNGIREDIESVLEIGVGNGECLGLWAEFFPNALIYGVDRELKHSDNPRITIFQIEQTDRDSLTHTFRDKHLEIIIDDASHAPAATISTLDIMFPMLQPRGWYVIEDMHYGSFPQDIGKWMGENSKARELHILPNKDKSCCIAFIRKHEKS